MESCPCGSGTEYQACCEPLIRGERSAQTAEQLMRSRYSAHAKAEIDYIVDTVHPSHRKDYNRKNLEAWCRKSEWKSLEVVATEGGGEGDDKGTVEFIANYREKQRPVKHHEVAEFARKDDRWYFVDGKPARQEQVVRQGPKVGRNDPCPCGSGKKYKKCCAV